MISIVCFINPLCLAAGRGQRGGGISLNTIGPPGSRSDEGGDFLQIFLSSSFILCRSFRNPRILNKNQSWILSLFLASARFSIHSRLSVAGWSFFFLHLFIKSHFVVLNHCLFFLHIFIYFIRIWRNSASFSLVATPAPSPSGTLRSATKSEKSRYGREQGGTGARKQGAPINNFLNFFFISFHCNVLLASLLLLGVFVYNSDDLTLIFCPALILIFGCLTLFVRLFACLRCFANTASTKAAAEENHGDCIVCWARTQAL